MLPFVAITLVLGYAPLPFHPNPIALFVTSLFSITPVAYYIGMAVARFTASSFLRVRVRVRVRDVRPTFSPTQHCGPYQLCHRCHAQRHLWRFYRDHPLQRVRRVVCVVCPSKSHLRGMGGTRAIWQGGLLELVRAGCIGSLLGDLLLLPGLSMVRTPAAPHARLLPLTPSRRLPRVSDIRRHQVQGAALQPHRRRRVVRAAHHLHHRYLAPPPFLID